MVSNSASVNPEFPISPRRLPFFYGWVVLLGAVIGIVMSIPGQTAGVSVFTDALVRVTGLSRVQFAVTYLVGTTLSSFLLPRGGRWLDRAGARLAAIASCLGLGTSLVFLSQVDRAGALLGAVLPLQAAMFAVLCVGFAALRFTGQGMLTLACRTMFARWFVNKRGLVSAVMGVFVTLSFSISPKLLRWLIESSGSWRAAWLTLAVLCGGAMTFIAWVLFRDSPEQVGLFPDGKNHAPLEVSSSDQNLSDGPSPGKEGVTRSQAMRSAPFWVVVLTLSIHSMVITGTTFHMFDLGREMGRDESFMVSLFPPLAMVSVLFAFAAGFVSDRFSLRPLLLLMLVCQAMAYYGFGVLDSSFGFYAVIIFGGITSGIFGTLTNVALAKLFGRAHLGSILGVQMSGLVLGSALGPAYLAMMKSYVSDYNLALTVAALFPIVPLLLSLFGRRGVVSRDTW